MWPAVDHAVPHAEDVPLGQLRAASRAREAGEVEHHLARPHDQLVGCDARAASRATFHAEQSGRFFEFQCFVLYFCYYYYTR